MDADLELLNEGGRSAGRYGLGGGLGEQTNGAIIGRAIRWRMETTGQYRHHAKPRE